MIVVVVIVVIVVVIMVGIVMVVMDVVVRSIGDIATTLRRQGSNAKHGRRMVQDCSAATESLWVCERYCTEK